VRAAIAGHRAAWRARVRHSSVRRGRTAAGRWPTNDTLQRNGGALVQHGNPGTSQSTTALHTPAVSATLSAAFFAGPPAMDRPARVHVLYLERAEDQRTADQAVRMSPPRADSRPRAGRTSVKPYRTTCDAIMPCVMRRFPVTLTIPGGLWDTWRNRCDDIPVRAADVLAAAPRAFRPGVGGRGGGGGGGRGGGGRLRRGRFVPVSPPPPPVRYETSHQ
jgi:hypothetical protein